MPATVQHPAGDALRPLAVGRGEVAIEDEGAEPIFDDANPGAWLAVEDTDEVVAVEWAFGTEGFAFFFLGAEAGGFEAVVVVMVVVGVAGVVGALEGEEVAPVFGDFGHEAADGAAVVRLGAVHVTADEQDDGMGFGAPELEAVEEGCGKFGADGLVAVEAPFAVGLHVADGRLAEVVQEGGPAAQADGLGGGGHCLHGRDAMAPDIELVEAVLFAANHRDEFREGEIECAGGTKDFEPAPGFGALEQLVELGCDPLLGEGGDEIRGFGHARERALFDLKVELAGEADAAEDAERVFPEAGGRVADSADDAGGKVFPATVQVEKAVTERIFGEGVDGEVAAGEVFLDGGAEGDVGPARAAAVGVAAERGDLAPEALDADAEGAEALADGGNGGAEPADEGLDGIGVGVGGVVLVVGVDADETVTQGAADEPELVAAGVEGAGEVLVGDAHPLIEPPRRQGRKEARQGQARTEAQRRGGLRGSTGEQTLAREGRLAGGLGYRGAMEGFELSASVVLWRGEEILVMKRGLGGFAGGGWFIPGGHVEQGERLHESAAREVFEETGISIDPGGLRLVDVMTYETGRGTAHTVIYNGECPAGAEPVINDEHLVWRWMTPEAYVARFLESGMLRGRGVPEDAVVLATEVARVVRAAAAAR